MFNATTRQYTYILCLYPTLPRKLIQNHKMSLWKTFLQALMITLNNAMLVTAT